MRVGILGSGLMGGKLGTIFARAGHEVVFSYARSRKKLEGLARDAGPKARAGTPAEAAAEADALLLAVHWSRIGDVLKQAGDLWGKVLVSCSLLLNADNNEVVVTSHLIGRGLTDAPPANRPAKALVNVFADGDSGASVHSCTYLTRMRVGNLQSVTAEIRSRGSRRGSLVIGEDRKNP